MNRLFKSFSNDSKAKSRILLRKRKIVALLNKAELPIAIPAICEKVRLSVPTGTKIINELLAEKLIIEAGKVETDNGRRPVVYKVNPECGYIVGLEILLKRVSLSVYNMEMEEVFECKNNEFVLENTPECLYAVDDFLNKCIDECGVDRSKILGLGIGITGRVNALSGESYNYFNFLDRSLTTHFADLLKLPVFVDNDTHVMGLVEQFFGKAQHVKNALVVNLSRGLGLAIINNGQVVVGDQGFAGEFGHMQFGDSTKLCMCGKRGCLGMETSGFALEENFKERIAQGEKTLVLNKSEAANVRYDAILQAALHGDELSIVLLHDIGFKLGKALGNVINLLNPSLVIVGGKFAIAREMLIDSIKSGMTHTALSHPLRSCQLTFSEMGKNSGVKGAAVQVLLHNGLIGAEL